MAKSRSRSVQRGSFVTANRRLSGPVYRLSSVLPSLLRAYEDRRAYNPARDYRRAISLGRVFTATVGLKHPSRGVARPGMLARDTFRFNVPRKVLICIRRKQRREVLHAAKRVGRGSGGGARRRNHYSEVSC